VAGRAGPGMERCKRGGGGDLRCFGSSSDLPALDLVLSGSEEVDESDGLEAHSYNLWQHADHLILHSQSELQHTAARNRIFVNSMSCR
jgi:hypothetical protein